MRCSFFDQCCNVQAHFISIPFFRIRLGREVFAADVETIAAAVKILVCMSYL
jgi:hypothetical protein